MNFEFSLTFLFNQFDKRKMLLKIVPLNVMGL